MDAAIRAIAEPRRREILRLVWTSELAAGESASHFDVTRPAVSPHLRLLKEPGLGSERRNGTKRPDRPRPERDRPGARGKWHEAPPGAARPRGGGDGGAGGGLGVLPPPPHERGRGPHTRRSELTDSQERKGRLTWLIPSRTSRS